MTEPTPPHEEASHAPGPPSPSAPLEPTASHPEGAGRKRRRRIRWFTQESVGAAALVLSLSLAGVNAWQALRGSNIVIAVPPETVILYRDQGPRMAGLSMAVRVPLVNRASADYGDVVTNVHAVIAHRGERNSPRFAYTSVVDPVMTERDARELQRNCEVHVRCVPADGFLATERLQALVDLPGGAARDQHFGFALDSIYCDQAPAACARYNDFDSALAALYSAPFEVRIDVEFSSDRRRGATCSIRINAAQRDFLVRRGWVNLPCSPPASPSA